MSYDKNLYLRSMLQKGDVCYGTVSEINILEFFKILEIIQFLVALDLALGPENVYVGKPVYILIDLDPPDNLHAISVLISQF